MNQVDIYIDNQRLDLFQDEEIVINLSVQNVQDISKVFTDFSQNFTVPASVTNNRVFSYYYRTDLDSSFDGRLRVAAQIEINSLPFRTGVIELESVQLKGTEAYAYSLTFYGDVVTLTDLFGEDYLYDLDFAELNHPYTDDAIYDRLTTDTYAPVFYPLMSPVKNWFYQSENNAGANDENNIAFRGGGGGEGHQGQRGIRYYELKPALKVTAILTAMEQKYGITFTGAFLSAVPFEDLSLWLHRKEGWMYEGQPNGQVGQKANFNVLVNGTFSIANDQWVVPPVPSLLNKDTIQFAYKIDNIVYAQPFFVDLYKNEVLVSTNEHTGNVAFSSFSFVPVNTGEVWDLRIRPSTNTNMQYRVYDFIAFRQGTTFRYYTVDMSAAGFYTIGGNVDISGLMPEIKVKDFLAGIIKMYNMVIVPTTSTSFLLQPLDDWYAAGSDKDYQEYLDITEYVVNRPPLYREIDFKYQETEQILGFQYLQTNKVGFGDLNVDFTFDGDEFSVELPFECPLFERLTDQETDILTNVLVYKSITREADDNGNFNPYLGAPILFYGYFDFYDFSETNVVGFVNDDGTHEEVNIAWYSNTSNRYSSAGESHSICFGADIDPYHLQSVNRSLYYNEYSNYITDLYSKQRRLYNVEAVLPIGKIITLNLQNAIIWNNTKYLVNNVSLNLSTGKAKFELLNIV